MIERKITDKKELYKLVSFLTMGDGGVYRNKRGKEYYFAMVQAEDHLDFVNLAKSILDNVIPANIRYIDRSKDTDANRKNQYKIVTGVHPVFTHMRDHIYIDNYKSISPHYLKLLDWESLSLLYMSDGSLGIDKRYKNLHYRVSLNLKRLSYGDQILLKRALEEKDMGIWNVNKSNKYFYLTLKAKFTDMFFDNIAQYIVPTFQYKLRPDYRTDNSLKNKDDDIV